MKRLGCLFWWACCVMVVYSGQVEGQHNHRRPRDGCPPTISQYPTETAAPSPSPSEIPTTSPAPTVTPQPTATASEAPTITAQPTGFPTESPAPSPSPSEVPTLPPTGSTMPSSVPSDWPSLSPTQAPTKAPSSYPSSAPTESSVPTSAPSGGPTKSSLPSTAPSVNPTLSLSPSLGPSSAPTFSTKPSGAPSIEPTTSIAPSSMPITITYIALPDFSKAPTVSPSNIPSDSPSLMPSMYPSSLPTMVLSSQPSSLPSSEPTLVRSSHPSNQPSTSPLSTPSSSPSSVPSLLPSGPSELPSLAPSQQVFAILGQESNKDSLSASPSEFGAPIAPSPHGFIDALSASPSHTPTLTYGPSGIPSDWPSLAPSLHPSSSRVPSDNPTVSPSDIPSDLPSLAPTVMLAFPSPLDRLNNESALDAVEGKAGPSAAPQLQSSLNTPFASAHPSALWSTSPTGASDLNSLNLNTHGPSTNVTKDIITTMEKYIMVTAVSSVVLENQNSTLDLQRISIFESIALGFLTHHYTHAINNKGIEFTQVTIIEQVPKAYPVRRFLEETANDELIGDDIVKTELPFSGDDIVKTELPFTIDIEIVFEVTGLIFPEDGFVFMDFQWLVETLFDVNLDDFHSRLDKSGKFRPISIQGETETTARGSESTTATGGQFNTWMIASIGAVALSVFLTAVLITGATRRARRQLLARDLSNSHEYGSSSLPFDHDLISRQLSPTVHTGLSPGLEEESLDGLKLVHSDSKSAVSTLGASTKYDHGSIFIPERETNNILRQLSTDNFEKEGSLNARMRKRLIEREVKQHGYQAGLSMEAILQATSSFGSDEQGAHHGLTVSVSADGTENPSPIAVLHGDEDFQQAKRGGGIFSTWFGRSGSNQKCSKEAATNVNVGQLIRASPHQNSHGCRRKRESQCMSIPSNAEVITVGESIREEHAMSTRNWKPQAQQLEEEATARIKPSPFKSIGNAALWAIGCGTKNEATKTMIPLSDEYGDDVDENKLQGDLRALQDHGAINSSMNRPRMKASTPIWLNDQPDHAMGFVNVQSGDLTAEASRHSSLSSFPISPHRFSLDQLRKHSVGDSTAASSWRRPGKIKTEFQSSPLQRRLARARADPPMRLNMQPSTFQVQGNEHYNGSEHPHKLPETVSLQRPHSKVHLIKKGSKLSRMERRHVPHTAEEYATSTGGRIGAAPMVEMNVASNKDAMILGSVVEEGGLELEWGLTI